MNMLHWESLMSMAAMAVLAAILLPKLKLLAQKNHLMSPNMDVKVSVQYNHRIIILNDVQTNDSTVTFRIYKVLNTL